MRSLIIGGLVALALAFSGWAGGIQSARAANPGPQNFALLQPTNAGCPTGIEVTSDPGPINMFIAPSASGGRCAPGIAVSVDPGPQQTPGMTFGLPLGAADCADGTATLNGILDALGGTPGEPGSGPPAAPASDPADPCPAGSAAMVGIENAIAAVESDPGPINCPAGSVATGPFGRGTLVQHPPSPNCPPGTTLAVAQNTVGTALGFLRVYTNPGPIGVPSSQLFLVLPSGIAGESWVQPGPIQ
jgi:hypothetical protein